MSSQKGNASRSRPQKYKNVTSFKNNLHDTSHITKAIRSIQVEFACLRCKEIIEWKIKYKKYKPLTVLKKCTNCGEKNIKRAYYILCDQCASNKCGKCGKERTPGEEDEEPRLKDLGDSESVSDFQLLLNKTF